MSFDQDKINLLNTISPQGEAQDSVDNISNYTPPDLSSSQLQAYQAQYEPAMSNPLPTNAYYPGIGHNVGVGNYAGSEIGSTTLFAPGGALVPFAVLDARNAAMNHAANRKAKDIEDFRKAYQSPTTKHVVVQKELTDTYNKGLQQWNQNALKKAGGDQALANQMLMQDPNFTAWNKSMQDTAKFHDAIVEHAAQLSKDEKDPNFVMSPETKKSHAELMNGIAYQGMSPFSKEGHDVGARFLGAAANYDLDKTVNTSIDKAIPNIEQLPPQYSSRGKNETATYLEKEYFTPEARQELAHNIYMEKYQGTGITEDQVQKNIDAKLGEKIKRKTDTYDKYFKPEPKAEPTYDDKSIVSESGEKVADLRGNIVNSATEHFVPTNANDQKKELKIAVSKGMTSADGTPVAGGETGYVKGYVQGIGVKPFYKKENRYLTDEEVKVMKERGTYNTTKDIEMRPTVIFNLASPKTETTDEQGNTVSEPGEQKTIYFPTDKIAGVFKGKEKGASDYESMRLKTEQYAAEKNKGRVQHEEEKSYPIKGKTYSESAIKKAAEASGMTVDEYIKAVSK